MKLEIKETSNRFCVTLLDGREIDPLDFGMIDSSTTFTKASMVRTNRFTRKAPTKKVLDKYSIDYIQYNKICNILEEAI